MNKFLAIQSGNILGFISTNSKTSFWGIKENTSKEELIASISEAFPNFSISFPKDVHDELTLKEQVAYKKLFNEISKLQLSHSIQLKTERSR